MKLGVLHFRMTGGSMYTRQSIILASILSLLSAGCAHYRKTTPLQKYDLRAGYRFEELAYDGKPKGQSSEEEVLCDCSAGRPPPAR